MRTFLFLSFLFLSFLCLIGCIPMAPNGPDNEAAPPDLGSGSSDMGKNMPDLFLAACHAMSDCPSSGLCRSVEPHAAGTCIAAEQILYVNQDETSCCPAVHDGCGTRTLPYCQIQAAIDAANTEVPPRLGERFLLVTPSARAYAPVAAKKGRFIIVGPWADPKLAGEPWNDLSPTGVILRSPLGGPASSLTVTELADVEVDGIRIENASMNQAVLCDSQTATLTLRRSLVANSANEGVRGRGYCNLSIAHSRIDNAQYSGIHLNCNRCSVTDTTVYHCGGVGILVVGDDTPGQPLSATFARDILTNNGWSLTVADQQPGGAWCSIEPPTPKIRLIDCILMGNFLYMGMQTNCEL